MRVKGLVGGLGVVLVLAVFAPAAYAATLVADYQFQNNFGSTGTGAGDIQNVGNGNKFVTETVGCKPATVLSFPKGSGLQLNNPNPGGDQAYSVVALFRLSDLSGYRRIFAPGGPGFVFNNDNGLYERDGRAVIYDNTAPGYPFLSPTSLFQPNIYAEVALTVPGDKGAFVTAYFNGAQAVQDPTETAQFDAATMRFFKDNDLPATPNEDSGGAVARIRIYSGPLNSGLLTPDEVAAIHAQSPIAGACDPSKNSSAAVNGKVKVKKAGKRFVVITGIDVSCPAGGGTCDGSAKVTKGAKSSRATTSKVPKKLGKAKLSVAAGATKAVKVKLTKKASSALRSKGKIKATISVSLSDSVGSPAVASRTAKLKAP